MICDDYRCVFIHVPKTGGSSIESALSNGRLNQYGKYGNLRDNYEQHWTYTELLANNPSLPLGEYFSFGFVRNPWDRMISEYAFGLKWFGLDRHITPAGNPSLSLREFLRLEEQYPRAEWVHWRSQHEFLLNKHGQQLVNFIGRYERLQSDFEEVCSILGLVPLKLPHITYGTERAGHYTDYYNDLTRGLVAERFAEDIAMFGYVFGE